jgi:radical SAM superfamily enzyme YgiQ (UPF0313 family)
MILQTQSKPEILKIKLISPRMSLRPMDSEFKRRMSPSLSLVTIASLTPGPHIVYIEDENLNPINYNDKPDFVGITVNVDTTYRAFEIARRYRDQGVKVIFGGIHASADPDLMLEHCDSVCIGEAEELWTTIINDLLNYQLKQKYFNPGSTDLRNVPVPKWEFISKKDYLYNNIVVTSRGCPFKCEFCYNSCDYINNLYRNRPVQNVIDEIKSLNTKRVMFIDDNLIGNLNWTNELINSIKILNISWHAAVSTNLVYYPELINKMSDSGCKSLFIGFESINANSIKSVNKGQNNTGKYEILIKQLHDKGIMVNASLVFGFDHDTNDTFSNTLDWLISNKVETMTAHILTPYPGTKIYKRLLKENRIIDYDLSKYNTSKVVFKPKNMSVEELQNGYLKMYQDFYSFKNIFNRKPDNKKLIAPYFIFNLGYRKFGKLTSLAGKLGFMNQIGKYGSKLSYGIE